MHIQANNNKKGKRKKKRTDQSPNKLEPRDSYSKHHAPVVRQVELRGMDPIKTLVNFQTATRMSERTLSARAAISYSNGWAPTGQHLTTTPAVSENR